MADVDLVLEFEIEPGRSPDLEKVARALLAWNDAVQAAVTAVAPGSKVVVELSGVEHGSQRFKQALRVIEDAAVALEEGGKEFPIVYRNLKALVKCIGGALLTASAVSAVIPDGQEEELKQIREILEEDRFRRQKSEEFFDTLQNEPAIAAVEFYEGDNREPTFVVARSEFGPRSGLFKIASDNEQLGREEVRIAHWDAVLIAPVLVGAPRRWKFAKDGIEFSATMADKAVLEAIRDKSLTIPFAEGVMMKIEVSYTEQYDGAVWRIIAKTRKVVRVLSPRVTLPPGALFAEPSRP